MQFSVSFLFGHRLLAAFVVVVVEIVVVAAAVVAFVAVAFVAAYNKQTAFNLELRAFSL